LPPELTGPTALALLWDSALTQWNTLYNRYNAAALPMATANSPTLASLLAETANAAGPQSTLPIDPSSNAAAASTAATFLVNKAVSNCATWISSLTFS
jgi:hypothetical protein